MAAQEEILFPLAVPQLTLIVRLRLYSIILDALQCFITDFTVAYIHSYKQG